MQKSSKQNMTRHRTLERGTRLWRKTSEATTASGRKLAKSQAIHGIMEGRGWRLPMSPKRLMRKLGLKQKLLQQQNGNQPLKESDLERKRPTKRLDFSWNKYHLPASATMPADRRCNKMPGHFYVGVYGEEEEPETEQPTMSTNNK